jgi:hypothetical protein
MGTQKPRQIDAGVVRTTRQISDMARAEGDPLRCLMPCAVESAQQR